MSSLPYSQLMSSKRKRVPDAEAVTSNGEGHAAAMEIEINEHKKSRMDQVDAPPSNVVHIRSLPSDATEQDVTLLAIPFGFLKNMVLSKKSSQALIEMELLESAIDMVAYYQQYPAILHGRQLVLQFSKHPHLELKAENALVSQAIQRANSVVQQDLSGVNQGNPNTVLRIVIDEIMDQQINHIIIYKIFHRFGKILRVIIFLKNDHYQGFIEFENHLQAFVAMLHLNRQNIYTGCCHLSVEFSKNRGPLEIRQESQKCRDYVLNPLTEEELISLRRLPSAGVSNNMAHGAGGSSAHGQGHAFGPNSAVAAAMSQFAGTAGGPTMLHPHQQTSAALPPAWVAAAANNSACRMTEFTTQLMALAQQAGLQLSPAAAAATASFMSLSAQSGAAFPNAANGAAINPTMASLLAFSAAANNAAANQGQSNSGRGGATSGSAGGSGQFSGTGSVSQSVNALQKLTAAQAAAAAAQSSSLAIRLPLNNNGSTVLIVSNLNEERVYPDALFTLFGVYGDVVRVKIMFNKKDTALVQFSDSQQAVLAMQYLNQKVLWGQPMKIAISRHNYVQLPKEDKDNHLTKDYSNNLLHRFRKPNSKNYQNIYPPSHVLHLSNIPSTVTEDDVRSLFHSKGFDVVGFRFMQKDNKMALVQLDSVESAMEALIALHNTQLSENSHLRISFSKSAI